MEFTPLTFIEWVYNKFLMVFIICLVGCIIRNSLSTIKKDKNPKIKIKRIISSSVICSVILVIILESFAKQISFSFQIFLCFMAGLWYDVIIEYVLSKKIFKALLKFLLKTFGKELSDSIDEAIDELDKEKEKKKQKQIEEKNEGST